MRTAIIFEAVFRLSSRPFGNAGPMIPAFSSRFMTPALSLETGLSEPFMGLFPGWTRNGTTFL
jgi:hypothetical protein